MEDISKEFMSVTPEEQFDYAVAKMATATNAQNEAPLLNYAPLTPGAVETLETWARLHAVPVRVQPCTESPVAYYTRSAENCRRKGANTLNMTPAEHAVADYATSGQRIEEGLHHLNEALPSGQHARIQYAFMLMRSGVEELAVWLRNKGVDV